MKDFIEITVFETGHKMLVSVPDIKFVEELTSGAAQIITGIAQGQFERIYVNTRNSYSEVIEKIRQASKSD